MRDIFAQLFAPNAQGQTNAFGSNPNALSLAGLIAATGNKSLGDALPAAAKIIHGQQIAQIHQQQTTQKQMQAMQPKETVVFNPVTGEAMVRRIQNGQVVGFDPIQPGMGMPQTQEGLGGIMNQSMPQQNMGQMQPQQQPFQQQQSYLNPKEQMEVRRERAEEQKEIRKENRKFFDEATTISDTAQKHVAILNSAKKDLGEFRQGVGAEFQYNWLEKPLNTEAAAAVERFRKKIGTIVNAMTSAEKGVQTEGDAARFADLEAKVGNTEKGNKDIVDMGLALTMRAKHYSTAAKEFIDKGKGDKTDFKNRWIQYSNAHPLVNEDGTINKENINNWRQYVIGNEAIPEQEREIDMVVPQQQSQPNAYQNNKTALEQYIKDLEAKKRGG